MEWRLIVAVRDEWLHGEIALKLTRRWFLSSTQGVKNQGFISTAGPLSLSGNRTPAQVPQEPGLSVLT